MPITYEWLEIPAESVWAYTEPSHGAGHAAVPDGPQSISARDDQAATLTHHYGGTEDGLDGCRLVATFAPYGSLPEGTLDGVYMVLRRRATIAGLDNVLRYYTSGTSRAVQNVGDAPVSEWGETAPIWLSGVPLSAVEDGSVNASALPYDGEQGVLIELMLATPWETYEGQVYSLDYAALMVRVPVIAPVITYGTKPVRRTFFP